MDDEFGGAMFGWRENDGKWGKIVANECAL